MKQFMDKDFLLTNEVAKELFFDVANTMPIVDYHCHIDPKEIAEDRKFENITQCVTLYSDACWNLAQSQQLLTTIFLELLFLVA